MKPGLAEEVVLLALLMAMWRRKRPAFVIIDGVKGSRCGSRSSVVFAGPVAVSQAGGTQR